MEFSVKMQPELIMSVVWIILGAVLFLVSVALFVVIIVCKKAPKKEKVKKEKPRTNAPVKLLDSKDRALISIDDTIKGLNTSEIDIRESYKRLSITLREFVSEMTGTDFTTLSLSELKKMKQSTLAEVSKNSYVPVMKKYQLDTFAELIEACYCPEFALKSYADFVKDAEKAKGMVRTWS